MNLVAHFIWWICLIFLLSLWARVILSYFSLRPGGPAESVNRVANTITEPILRPVRRVLPTPRVGAGAIDLSPILVSFAVIIIMNFLP